MTRITRRKTDQSLGGAKRGASKRRGARRPMKTGKKQTPVDLIGQTGPESDFDFEPPRMSDDIGLRVPDFSEDAPLPRQPTSIAKVTSREFNQDVGKAKRAAERGPVTITDRGRPAFVLMTYEEYRRLAGPRRSIADLLNHEESKHLDFEPERMGDWSRPFDFD